jgi:hypothetical protein
MAANGGRTRRKAAHSGRLRRDVSFGCPNPAPVTQAGYLTPRQSRMPLLQIDGKTLAMLPDHREPISGRVSRIEVIYESVRVMLGNSFLRPLVSKAIVSSSRSSFSRSIKRSAPVQTQPWL